MAILLATLLTATSPPADGWEESPFLSYTTDSYKTIFVSSNLTAVMTNDWPRIAFYHTRDRFSSTFDIGMPVMYLFNDTNGDGMFTRAEITHFANLDEGHVTWDIAGVRLSSDATAGQYAVLGRSANISLFESRAAEVPLVDGWARAHFSFVIAERAVAYQNDLGNYLVDGKIAMRISVTIEVLRPTNCSGIVLEQTVKGGMTVNTFLLTEEVDMDQLVQTRASSRVDETVNGSAFAHRFDISSLPTQSIEMAKEDGTVQAYYRFSSVPVLVNLTNTARPHMSCSYFTTGSGMILHTAYMAPDANGTLVHDVSLGLVESGFYAGVRDWFSENLPVMMIVSGTVVAAVSIVLFVMIYRKSRKPQNHRAEDDSQKKDAGGQGT